MAGSISFARIVLRWARPGARITPIEVDLPGGETFVSDTVSATAVRMQAGPRYGCLTALLDMAKVAVPTLAVRLWAPDEPYYLIVAAAAVIGHDWPLLGRYKGGRGESPLYGGVLVIDPVAAVGTTLLGALLGIVVGNILVLRWAGMVLLIPWMGIAASGDPWTLAYIVVGVGAYFVAMIPELRQYASMLGRSTDPTNEEIAVEFAMGAGLGRALDRYGLIPRLRRRTRSGGSDPGT
ncbi:MAG TPA: glycerol-3-phosphate acyltransferase [Candidatus Limnocylindrales bacterium]|nr:glycerol-3-phosphate acyltransferase [Candidatus Limnocylindrales bacterium]